MYKKITTKLAPLHNSGLEGFVNMHGQTLSAYVQLNQMGFGLKRLDFLRTTVNEIAYETSR
ncbi:MAG: hypothetical protein WA364_19500 [Candidatus Nitrosopolaris sp.]